MKILLKLSFGSPPLPSDKLCQTFTPLDRLIPRGEISTKGGQAKFMYCMGISSVALTIPAPMQVGYNGISNIFPDFKSLNEPIRCQKK